ncbi:MAG: TraR/DksA C4-type zinc finger protein [Bacteroidota bacterium]
MQNSIQQKNAQERRTKEKSRPKSRAKKNERKVYTQVELAEFKKALDKRLQRAQRRQDAVRISLSGDTENGLAMGIVTLEDSADVAEKESLVSMTNRQQKFILELEAAMERIDTGDYGICISTGQLINKARLGVVPHTRLDVSAKIADREVMR